MFEPNDTFATARNLNTLGNYNAPGYRSTLLRTSTFSASPRLQWPDFRERSITGFAGRPDLNAYDAGQSLITTSNGVLDGESVTFSVSQGSTYYLRVYGYNGAVNPSYNLLIGFTHSGDYNDNFRVDAADYVLWRHHQGQSVAQFMSGDGDGSSVVGAGDYNVWRSNFGNVVPSADPSLARRQSSRAARKPRPSMMARHCSVGRTDGFASQCDRIREFTVRLFWPRQRRHTRQQNRKARRISVGKHTSRRCVSVVAHQPRRPPTRGE